MFNIIEQLLHSTDKIAHRSTQGNQTCFTNYLNMRRKASLISRLMKITAKYFNQIKKIEISVDSRHRDAFFAFFATRGFATFSLEFNHQMGAYTFVTLQHFTVIIESLGNLTRPPSGKQKTRKQRKSSLLVAPAGQRCVTPKCVYCASWEKVKSWRT